MPTKDSPKAKNDEYDVITIEDNTTDQQNTEQPTKQATSHKKPSPSKTEGKEKLKDPVPATKKKRSPPKKKTYEIEFEKHEPQPKRKVEDAVEKNETTSPKVLTMHLVLLSSFVLET